MTLQQAYEKGKNDALAIINTFDALYLNGITDIEPHAMIVQEYEGATQLYGYAMENENFQQIAYYAGRVHITSKYI